MSTAKATPQSLIRAEVRRLVAYPVPRAQGLIKLDAMENPYTWPEDLIGTWLDRLRDVSLNRYPDPHAAALCQRLREVMAIPDDASLILGNGSDELIQLIMLAVAGSGRTVLAPQPSFVMYRMIAEFVGLRYVGVPLRPDDFSLDRRATLEAIEHHRPAVVFIAYPNNPTGNLFDEDDVREILDVAPGLVVVDEAYVPFSSRHFLSYLGKYENLLVMRTLSKLGLAGLRLGFVVGGKRWLTEIDKIRLPYNINVLTQVSAEFAMSHYDVLDSQAHRICVDRELMIAELNALPGIVAYPSEANFILFRTPNNMAARIFKYLVDNGVLIKAMGEADRLLLDCLRVTVGTRAQDQVFLARLSAALSLAPPV